MLNFEDELDVVDPGEIDGSGRLRILGVQSEGEAIHETLRNQSVVLVRLHETEILGLATGETRQVVETEMDVRDRIAAPLTAVIEVVVAHVLAFPAHSPDQLDDGMIEVELHTDLAGLGANGVALQLSDQLLEGSNGESITLGDVQVDISGVNSSMQIVRT